VTPSYNQVSFVEEALDSVKDQNYPPVSHIVVDGASRMLHIPTTSTFFTAPDFSRGQLDRYRLPVRHGLRVLLRLANAGYPLHIPYLLADFHWHSESKPGSQNKKQLAEHDEMLECILRP